MAGVNMGELWFSLDIKSKIEKKLHSYSGNMGAMTKKIAGLQDKINALSGEMDKLGKGSDVWKQKREEMRGYFRDVETDIQQLKAYERAYRRVAAIQKSAREGGKNWILGPSRQVTSLLDTKPIEEQIKRQEKAMQVYREMVQAQKELQAAVSMGARNKNEGLLGVDYVREKQRLAELKATFESLANGKSFQQIKDSTQGLYEILMRYNAANERAISGAKNAQTSEQRRAKTLEDARVAYGRLDAELQKAEAKERAHRAAVEASRQAAQRRVRTLREHSEALLRDREAALANQKAQMGALYRRGVAAGLSPQELAAVRDRYLEISRALLNLRTMMQHSGSMPYGMNASIGKMGLGNIVQEANNRMRETQALLRENARAARDFASAFDKVHGAAARTSQVVSDLKNMFLQGGLIYAAQRLANNIVQQGGMIEQQHIALRAMLGNASDADKLFGQIKEMAINSPFTFSEMIRDTKQLVAFGVEEENVYETTKRLADISAGLGVSFERLGLAFGQTKARGWLDGKELRQFAYAGLPLLQKLSELYTQREGKAVSTSEVRTRITKRNVPFEDVRAVLWQLTDAGGQFYEMQDVLTNTLLGKYNKLKDAWDIMLSGFTNGGNLVGGTFKVVLDALAEIIQRMNTLGPLLVTASAAFGGRRILGALGSGLGLRSLTRDLNQANMLAMRRYGVKQMEKALNGEITAQEMQQNMIARQKLYNQMQQNGTLYRQLALQGSLKPAELARLLNNRRQTAQVQAQNAALMRQLQLMGVITARQGQMILNGNRLGLAFSRIGTKLGGLFSGGNLATAAIAAIGAIWASAYEVYERNKEKANEAARHAADTIKNVREKMEEAADKPLTEKLINDLREVLIQSNAYTTSMDDQIKRAGTLAEKYDVIKEKVAELQMVQDRSDVLSRALSSSKYGTYDNFWQRLIGARSNDAMVVGPSNHTWLHNQIFNEGIEENLMDLKRAQNALEDLQKTGVASASKLREAKDRVAKAWREIATDDAPRMAYSMAHSLHQVDVDWKRLGAQARKEFWTFASQLVSMAGEAGTEIGSRLFADIMISRVRPNTVFDTPLYKQQLKLWERFYQNNFTRVRSSRGDTGLSDDDGNGNGRGTSRRDTELERIRNRVELYKKFYSEYKKLSEYMGGAGALQELERSGDFKTVFGWKLSDVTNYSVALDALTKSLRGTTEARRKFLNEAQASKSEKSREDLTKSIEGAVQTAKSELDEYEKRYGTYRTIVRATGNKEMASQVAYGQRGAYEAMPNRRTLALRVLAGRYYGGDLAKAEQFMNLSREEMERQVGAKSPQGVLWQSGRDAEKKDLDEVLKLYEDLIAKHNTIEDQIANENNLYEEQVKALDNMRAQGKIDSAEYDRRRGSLDTTHAGTLNDLSFKQFKQSSGWEQIFRDLDRVSKESLSEIETNIRDFMQRVDTSQMSEENVRTLVEALDKLREHLEKASPFESMAQGYGQLSYIAGIRRNQAVPGMKDTYTLSAEQAARLGVRRSANDRYSGSVLRGVEQGVYKGFANSISALKDDFSALQSVLQPVTDLFSALGESGPAHVMQMGSSAMSSMVSVAGGMQTLSQAATNGGMAGLGAALGAAGPYAAAAGAALSVASSLFGGKTSSQKAFEKQAEYLKNIEATTRQINDNLRKQLQEGGGSTAQATGDAIIANYETEASETRLTAYRWARAKKHAGGNRNRMKTNIDFNELTEFLLENGWNGELADGSTIAPYRTNAQGETRTTLGGENVANLSGAWLELYRNAHAGNWAKINSELREYLEKLIEIEGEDGEIAETRKSIVEQMTNLTFDDLKDEYKSLLDDLDSSNEDFAESFEKHMREAILSTMLTNLYKDKIQQLIDETSAAASAEIGNQYVASNGQIKTHTGGDDSADVLSEYTAAEMAALQAAADNLGDDMRARRDLLERLYGWTGGSDNSLSSSIKGIQEETADILSSYVNALRGDVSVMRQLQTSYLPKLDLTATAQLQQLGMIAQNTLRSAQAAERMETAVVDMQDMLSRSQNDTRAFSVRVK